MSSTFGDLLPPLRRLADLPLESQALQPYWTPAGGLPEFTSSSGERIETVGGLLGLRPDQVAVNARLAIPLLRVLARISSDVFDLLDQTAAEAESGPESGPGGLSGPPNRDAASFGGHLAPMSPARADPPGSDQDWVRELVIRRAGTRADRPSSGSKVGEICPNLVRIGSWSLLDRRLDSPPWAKDLLALNWLRDRLYGQGIADLLDLTREDFLGWRQIGVGKANRIVALLRHWDSVAAQFAPAAQGGQARPIVAEVAERDSVGDGDAPVAERSEPDADLDLVLEWAVKIAGAETWFDVIRLVDEAVPAEVAEAGRRLLHRRLDDVSTSLGVGSRHRPTLDLEPRSRAIVFGRIVASKPRTLDDIGRELGVTRERVRQLEGRIERQLRERLENDPELRWVDWACERLLGAAGSFAPREVLQAALPGLDPETRKLVMFLSGYVQTDHHLVRKGFVLPSSKSLPVAPGSQFVVDEFLLHHQLEDSGITAEHMDEAMDSIAGTRRVGGQLVVWPPSLADQAVAVLEIRDEPQTIEAIHDEVGRGEARSFRNRVLDDPRIMRVTKSKVGLRAWGGSQYTSVVELMRERLGSGPQDIEELAAELSERYEVSGASVRMYAHAPIFKVIGDVIALRNRTDPYEPRHRPDRVRGLFIVDDLLSFRLEVDTDLLRGSGRALPFEVATFLGVCPGESITLQADQDEVRFTWLDTSHVGPAIGSLKTAVERLGAVQGAMAVLIFDRGARTLEVKLAWPPETGSPRSIAEQWLGLPKASIETLNDLADAMGVVPGEVVTTLQRRGEDAILDAIAPWVES
jgi:hypothetical protein